MSTKKRFRDLFQEVKREKEEALQQLDEEYKVKRQKIDEEYDFSFTLESLKDCCSLCDINDPKWKCPGCSYILCSDCINSIRTARVEVMKHRLGIFKLGTLSIAQAKKNFMKQGMKCPKCRTKKFSNEYD